MNYYMENAPVNGMHCRGIVHTVKKGDTLYRISRIYGVPLSSVICSNPGVRIYNLQVGDRICVPLSVSAAGQQPETLPYVVRPTDSLMTVLRMFDMSWEELSELNPDTELMFKPDTVLNIPAKKILRTG